MKKCILLLAFLFSAALLAAQERILSFDARAEVHPDGRVHITETIVINAEHRQIRRGIYRDIPIEKSQDLTVRGLLMDGQTHPYFTESNGNVTRINFGDDDYISKGLHKYVLSYSMYGVLGRFEKYDEIYWNVTGNGWDFPIEQARAEVLLPPQAQVIWENISFYTGPKGAKGHAAQRQGLSFQTTLPLNSREGLTVAVPFEKGVLQKDAFLQKIQFYRYILYVLVAVLLAMVIYYAWKIWDESGRDPEARPLRQFTPPEGLSPAQVRYIWRMGDDAKHFPLVICSLAMKGAIRITEEKKLLSRVFVLDKLPPSQPLAKEEQSLWDALPYQLKITKQYNPEVLSLARTVSNRLANIHKKNPVFATNFQLSLPVNIPILSFLATLFASESLAAVLVYSVIICIFTISVRSAPYKWALRVVAILIPLIAGLAPAPEVTGRPVLFCMLLISIVYVPAAAYFEIKLMPAYTVEGRKIMDQIEGFREYLSIAEKFRVLESQPADAQKIFCDYLPYAIALDVENKWIKTFEKILGSAALTQAMNSRGFATSAGVAHALSAMSATSRSACSKPGKGSSGSGGGGCSGGGCGGGGGGGR